MKVTITISLFAGLCANVMARRAGSVGAVETEWNGSAVATLLLELTDRKMGLLMEIQRMKEEISDLESRSSSLLKRLSG